MVPPKRARSEETSHAQVDPEGMFRGMVVFLVETGVQPRRFQVILLFAALHSRLLNQVIIFISL